jgi:hypothetical protein
LQKKVWYLPEHNVWLSSGISGENSDFFDLNELDIEFEFKNQKLDVLTNIRSDDKNVNNNPYRYSAVGGHCHLEEITDLIEIRKPQLILTACMDKLIRLISLSERSVKGNFIIIILKLYGIGMKSTRK